MDIVTAYKAFDGELFLTKEECEEYEGSVYEAIFDNPVEVCIHNGKFYMGYGYNDAVAFDSFERMMGEVYYSLTGKIYGGENND